MTILNVLSADEIVRAVSLADVAAFTRVPGVGRKTAERLCFELKNSLSREFTSTIETTGAGKSQSRVVDTVGEALRSLGFVQDDVSAVFGLLRAALAEGFDKLDEEGLLKAALKELQRK